MDNEDYLISKISLMQQKNFSKNSFALSFF